MNLPKIDMDDLPDIEAANGMFGSLSDLATAGVDDRVIVIMVYVYDMIPPDSMV